MEREDGTGASTSPAPDEPDASFEFVPAPTVAALDACRYARWHAIPELAKHAYGSVTVRLPPEYVQYLLEDGVHLAADSEAMPARVTPQLDERLESAFTEEDERDDEATATKTTTSDDERARPGERIDANDDSFAALKAKYGQSEGASDGSEDGDEEHAVSSSSSARSFPETDEAVRAAIAALGGAATPKLTWSAPKDAVWMATGNTTMCRNPGEVLLLLKASDAIAFDLTEAYDCCADVTDERVASLSKDVALHLRRWRDVRPALEFRLFVRDGDLVGMCQRDCSNFYPFLTERKQKDTLEETLVLFWQDVVSGAFECADCDSYALDAYVTSANAVKIVDFNHWGGGTLPLMFTWAELEARRRNRSRFGMKRRVRRANARRKIPGDSRAASKETFPSRRKRASCTTTSSSASSRPRATSGRARNWACRSTWWTRHPGARSLPSPRGNARRRKRRSARSREGRRRGKVRSRVDDDFG